MVGKSADDVVSGRSYRRVGTRLREDLPRVLFWERYRNVGGNCSGSLENNVWNWVPQEDVEMHGAWRRKSGERVI